MPSKKNHHSNSTFLVHYLFSAIACILRVLPSGLWPVPISNFLCALIRTNENYQVLIQAAFVIKYHACARGIERISFFDGGCMCWKKDMSDSPVAAATAWGGCACRGGSNAPKNRYNSGLIACPHEEFGIVFEFT
jgi:hypothetical protein